MGEHGALDCPFCGARPQMRDEVTGPLPFRVICGCGALGPESRTRMDAIAAWNRRAEPTAQQRTEAIVARLREWVRNQRDADAKFFADIIEREFSAAPAVKVPHAE